MLPHLTPRSTMPPGSRPSSPSWPTPSCSAGTTGSAQSLVLRALSLSSSPPSVRLHAAPFAAPRCLRHGAPSPAGSMISMLPSSTRRLRRSSCCAPLGPRSPSSGADGLASARDSMRPPSVTGSPAAVPPRSPLHQLSARLGTKPMSSPSAPPATTTGGPAPPGIDGSPTALAHRSPTSTDSRVSSRGGSRPSNSPAVSATLTPTPPTSSSSTMTTTP